MATPLNPQEIFLLERYTSLEYLREVRNAWGEMIKHVERCLDEFMRNLPPDYRRRPLPEQPDAVWDNTYCQISEIHFNLSVIVTSDFHTVTYRD